MISNDTLVERVKKLLSLASSPNENEAKLAMQKAQELIAKYCIDLSDTNNVEDIIEEPYECPVKSPALQEHLPYISFTIAGIFSCTSLIKGSSFTQAILRSKQIFLVGYKTNILITKHALDSILNQLNAEFKRQYKIEKSIGFSTAFWLGARDQICKRFKPESKVGKEGTGIVLYDKVKDYINTKYPNLGIYKGESHSNYKEGIAAGIKAGDEVSIRPGVQIGNQGKLLR